MRASLSARARDVAEIALMVGVLVAFCAGVIWVAVTFGGEPVICPLGSPEPSCSAYRQQLGAEP